MSSSFFRRFEDGDEGSEKDVLRGRTDDGTITLTLSENNCGCFFEVFVVEGDSHDVLFSKKISRGLSDLMWQELGDCDWRKKETIYS